MQRLCNGDGRFVEVDEVLDCWLAPNHRYFKVLTGDGIYILRNDSTSGGWEVTVFERSRERRRRKREHVPAYALTTLLLLATMAVPARAQAPNETLLLLRTATDRGAYHFAGVSHKRGRLIALDIGYIDFDNPKLHREMWIGGGGVPFEGRRGFLITEGFLARAFGEHANGALYFQPYFLGSYRLAPSVPLEASYLAYVPLNDAGRAQHLLEHVKLEYDFARLKAGAGYSAYKFGDEAWQHKPFITATLNVGALGNFEFWLQRVPDDQLAVQFRYAKVFLH